MVNDTLLSNSDSIILVVYLVLRLETLSTPLFDNKLIGLEIPDQAQPVIKSGSQFYEGY